VYASAYKPCDLLPAYYATGKMYKDIHLSEQWTVSKLNSLCVIIFRQDITYLNTIITDCYRCKDKCKMMQK